MKKYKVTINGVETTLLLTDADAKAQGLKPSDEPKAKEAKAPANKERSPSGDKRAEAVSRAFGQKKPAGGDAD